MSGLRFTCEDSAYVGVAAKFFLGTGGGLKTLPWNTLLLVSVVLSNWAQKKGARDGVPCSFNSLTVRIYAI